MSPDPWRGPVEDWLHGQEVTASRSPHTVAAYRRDLEDLVRWLRERHPDLPDWGAVKAEHLRAWLGQGRARGLAESTLQRRLSALRRFLDHLVKTGVLPANPARGLSAPRKPRRLPATLEVDQVTALLDAAPRDDPLALRDRAMLELFYSAAVRLAELAGADLADLDLEGGWIRVLGKGGRERLAPLGGPARAALRDWLRVRPQLAAAGETALFVGRRGTRLSHRAIQQRLAQAARRHGLDRPLHPHLLRHACATHLLESSGDLRAVQELLGHANLSTTQIYTHLDFQHLAQVYDRAHPRARRKGGPKPD